MFSVFPFHLIIYFVWYVSTLVFHQTGYFFLDFLLRKFEFLGHFKQKKFKSLTYLLHFQSLTCLM